MLAESNYEMHFAPDSRLSERVIFPVAPTQSNGIEDARFVRFQNDDGTRTYYATYTAYDGRMILPQLLETPDFLHFKFSTLNGPEVQNKGMALFPRKINGHYAMLSRQDNENIYLMFSDICTSGTPRSSLLKPTYPVGIRPARQLRLADRDRGRLAGADPRRRADAEVRIGAFLLDRDDPTRVIGRLREPLHHAERERARRLRAERRLHLRRLLHGRELIIPYAMSDYATTFATVPLDDVLAAME